MGRDLTDHDIEALLAGEARQELAELGRLLEQLRSLAEVPVPDTLVARHVAMMAAAVSPSPVTELSTGSVTAGTRPRRRMVLSGILSTLLGKMMAATVAVAAAASGVAVVADGAVPGDALYGIDRALERVGVFDGGAAERLAEAEALMARDLPAGAMAKAAEAAEAAGGGEAAAALTEAAAAVGGAEGEVSSLTREQVVAILELLAAQISNGGVIGEEVAVAAGSLVDTVQAVPGEADLPEEAPPSSLPADDGEQAPEGPAATAPTTLPTTTLPPTTVPDEAGSGGSHRP